MRQWVWGLVALVFAPACTLYWADGHDAGDDYPADARVVIVDAPIKCAVVLRYDWNDGTAQGWTASTSVSNASGALVFTNQGNGSLQAFGPQVSNALAETDVISFRVRIDQYSAISAPSQLTQSVFSFNTPFAGDGSLIFKLDVSSLAFGQAHVYTFPVSAGTFMGSLSRAAFLGHAKFASLLFADQTFSSNTSAGRLDDFAVVRPAGCIP